MSVDLYHVNLNSIGGTDLYQLVVDFTHVDRPPIERPHEGYLLDFKRELGEKFLQTVAAFANTFGGLIILGIDEDKDGRPDNPAGITSPGELKTDVANAISSNLVPCPPFDIAECSLPKDPNQKLCVVRVRETAEICLITKKGVKNPIYVRVGDRSEPADASAVRALFEKKRQVQNDDSELKTQLDNLRHRLTFNSQDGFGQVVYGDTFFRLLLVPVAGPFLPLDTLVENKFSDLVLRPEIVSLINTEQLKYDFRRARDWFDVVVYDPSHQYQRRWQVTSHADMGFITQTRWPISGARDAWSLYDLTVDFIETCKLAKQFWQNNSYYGAFRLEAQIRVHGLTLSVGQDGFHPLYYERIGRVAALPLQRDILAIAKSPHSTAGDTSADSSFADLDLRLDEIVAGELNQLLRSLGHSAEIEKLKQAIRLLI